jgi:hypothetical protein
MRSKNAGYSFSSENLTSMPSSTSRKPSSQSKLERKSKFYKQTKGRNL